MLVIGYQQRQLIRTSRICSRRWSPTLSLLSDITRYILVLNISSVYLVNHITNTAPTSPTSTTMFSCILATSSTCRSGSVIRVHHL
jgi:hypothetical protein